MSDLNKVQIIGRMAKAPELKKTNGGNSVLNADFATNYKYKDETKSERESTDWHRVTFYSGLADVVNQYMKKGSRAYIEGRLKYSKYTDKGGIERYTTEIVASDLQMLD